MMCLRFINGRLQYARYSLSLLFDDGWYFGEHPYVTGAEGEKSNEMVDFTSLALGFFFVAFIIMSAAGTYLFNRVRSLQRDLIQMSKDCASRAFTPAINPTPNKLPKGFGYSKADIICEKCGYWFGVAGSSGCPHCAGMKLRPKMTRIAPVDPPGSDRYHYDVSDSDKADFCANCGASCTKGSPCPCYFNQLKSGERVIETGDGNANHGREGTVLRDPHGKVSIMWDDDSILMLGRMTTGPTHGTKRVSDLKDEPQDEGSSQCSGSSDAL